MRFSGKTFLVTGASSGIGRAVAHRLAAEGAALVAVGRSLERLSAARPPETAQWRPFACDVSDEAQIKGLMDSLRTEKTTLHGMVHCAGIHALRPLKLLGSEQLNGMYASHLVSSVELVRHMIMSRLTAEEGASVVLISSAAALRGGSGTIAYASAKAAVIAAAKSLAVELSSRKVRVNVISPGVVRTPQGEEFLRSLPAEQRAHIEKGHPLGLGAPEDVSGVAAFLLSEDARWMTGANVIVDGGLTLQ